MLSDPTWFNLIYPAIVAFLAAALSYLATYRLKLKANKLSELSLKIDFADKMLITLHGLNNQLIKLCNDPNQYGYFSLINISAIKPILQRTQFLLDDKLSLFTDFELRTSLLDTLDSVSTMIYEIELCENYPSQAYTDHQNTIKETSIIRVFLKLRLIETDIIIDDNGALQLIPSTLPADESKEKRLKYVKSLVNDLDQTIKTKKEQVDKVYQQINHQRSYLAAKIPLNQNKIKDLINMLAKTLKDLRKQKDK